MAKAEFHKSQRVFVEPVGTWALIERVVPHWVKDVPEPLRITYDCGLGRDFQAHELVSEHVMNKRDGDQDGEEEFLLDQWRIDRKPAKWRADGVQSQAMPATFPVVVTDDSEWGGWRVPGAEYDRDPQRIEHQARMIVSTPDLLRLSRKLAEYANDNPDAMPDDVVPIVNRCNSILQFIYQLDVDEAEYA